MPASGQMQAQRPLQPLFPAGAGPTLQTQQEFPPGQGPAPQASNSGLPVMPHEPEPAKGPAPTLFPGGGLAAVQQPTSSLPASDASDLNGLQHTSIPQHAPGQHDMAGAHQMPGFQHMAIPPHMQAHMQPRSPAGDERVALCLTLLVRRLWTSLDAARYLILCTLQQRASRCLPSVGHVRDGTELQHPVCSKSVSLSRSR